MGWVKTESIEKKKEKIQNMKLGLQDVLGNFDFVFYKKYDVEERRSLKIKKNNRGKIRS